VLFSFLTYIEWRIQNFIVGGKHNYMCFLTRVRGSILSILVDPRMPIYVTTVQLQIGPVHYAKTDQNLIK